jgi:hypothetical protein
MREFRAFHVEPWPDFTRMMKEQFDKLPKFGIQQ